MNALTEHINDILPQTQCKECGFDGCRPYAEALTQGQTTIDRCAPGGIKVLEKLSHLLATDPNPYRQIVEERFKPAALAVILEDQCIGCTKCIQACPTDAIIGTGKWMHVILNNDCTGCGLCIPPCPVDCIVLTPVERAPAEQQQKASEWRIRHEQRLARLEKETHLQAQQGLKKPSLDLNEQRKLEIAEALARAKSKQQNAPC